MDKDVFNLITQKEIYKLKDGVNIIVDRKKEYFIDGYYDIVSIEFKKYIKYEVKNENE